MRFILLDLSREEPPGGLTRFAGPGSAHSPTDLIVTVVLDALTNW
jgi:hypothetical protein